MLDPSLPADGNHDAVDEIQQAFGGESAAEAIASARRWAFTTTARHGVRPADERAIISLLQQTNPRLGQRSAQFLAHHLS